MILVTAHPDDEAMFFIPAIQSFQQRGYTVYAICLSTGNYDGLGRRRASEYLECCTRVLGVPEKHCKVIDHPKLQDGPLSTWDDAIIADVITSELEPLGLGVARRVFLTFDEYGVSGHTNHVHTARGVKSLVGRLQSDSLTSSLPSTSAELWTVTSTPLPVKFSGAVGAAVGLIAASASRVFASPPTEGLTESRRLSISGYGVGETDLVGGVRATAMWELHQAMQAHWSQYVWFRALYVVFALYTMVCPLKREL